MGIQVESLKFKVEGLKFKVHTIISWFTAYSISACTKS
jgi:hypothetical protein